MDHVRRRRPVVFVGPYEHHSNEVSWRESLAEVVAIGLTPDGGLDLADLDRKAGDPRYEGRLKIGSLSAASNVTGMKTPVYEAARILHRHGALACFDFAACAPYVAIDMNRDAESRFDAVFFSPHKFLGGPGTSGLLLFNRHIYREDLAPTFASGGTVDYVGPVDQDYAADIETREKPGTPGTLQLLKAMLAIELKEAIGQDVIEERERDYTRRMMERFLRHPGIEVLGNPDPDRRIGIVSFNLRHKARYLHPKLVTRLLNDLFGIQSRAGCSCAGPYGHRLLNIGPEESHRYREVIHTGCQGLKPGWVRLSLHYCMDDADVDYLCRAVEFLAEAGHLFLRLYRFDLGTGAWCHADECGGETSGIGIREALAAREEAPAGEAADSRVEAYARYLAEAQAVAARLWSDGPADGIPIPGLPEDLVYFEVNRYSAGSGDETEE
jgi:selenocysteine lyase/cysteine desulfurase